MSNENQEQNNIETNNIDIEKKEEKNTDLIEKIESNVDWNLISIFSVWIFLCFTFFCIFVK